MSSISVQNWRRDKRIDARRRLVENEQIGFVHKRATEPHLLLHAARELARRAVREGPETRGVEQLFYLDGTLRRREPEEPRHEIDILVDAQLQIEILAEPLRHIGDARTSVAAMARVGHIAVERKHLPLLNLL